MMMSLCAVMYLWSLMLMAFQSDGKIFRPLSGMNKRLDHSSVVRSSTASLVRCLDKCMYRTNCLSINYDLATHQCELLKVNSSSYAEGVESKPGCLHVDLLEWLEFRSHDPCSSRPCGINQRCIGTKHDFVTCPDKEKHCEEVMLVSGPHGVPDNQITASSLYGSMNKPHFARLDSSEHWHPKIQAYSTSFIQVEFNKLETVKGVVTRGANNRSYWVTKYKIAVSVNCVDFQFLGNSISKQIFDGNTDQNSPVTNYFEKNILARCLKVYPLEYMRYIVMRFDVIGCLESDQLA